MAHSLFNGANLPAFFWTPAEVPYSASVVSLTCTFGFLWQQGNSSILNDQKKTSL
jgi:hypothetical protein